MCPVRNGPEEIVLESNIRLRTEMLSPLVGMSILSTCEVDHLCVMVKGGEENCPKGL